MLAQWLRIFRTIKNRRQCRNQLSYWAAHSAANSRKTLLSGGFTSSSDASEFESKWSRMRVLSVYCGMFLLKRQACWLWLPKQSSDLPINEVQIGHFEIDNVVLVWGENNNFFFAVGDLPEGNIVDGRLTCNIVDGATKSSKIAVLLSFKYAKVANSQYVASVDHDRREDRPHKHRGFEHASSNPRVVTFCCFVAFCFFFFVTR